MQNYATQNSAVGFYIFADDENAYGVGKTGLSITTSLSKNGGAASVVSPTITEISGGWYFVTPIASFRDTLGQNLWLFTATGAVISGRLERVGVVNPDATGFGSPGLDAAGVRSAVGLASASLDSQLAAIDTVVDAILVDTDATLPALLQVIDDVVDAIKLKTDNLTSDPASEATLDAINTLLVNLQTLTRSSLNHAAVAAINSQN